MIQIQNLTKKYNEQCVFDNTSFTFPDKGLFCIFGASGCGKSTLLNIIAGFDSHYDGELQVHGNSLKKMPKDTLCSYRRNNIGFVFQNYHLISGYTVMENLLLASDLTEKSQEDCKQTALTLLEKVGISEKSDQKIETLSGGQKQRVAIARALMNNPSILLADEPTGALDRKNSSEVMQLLQTLSKDILVICITHDKKCTEYAQAIIQIQNKKLVCDHEILNFEQTSVLLQKPLKKIPIFSRALKNATVRWPRYLMISLIMAIGVVCFTLSLSSENIMKMAIEDFQLKNTAYHNGYIKIDNNAEELMNILLHDERIENIYKQYILSDINLTVEEQTVTMQEKYPTPKATEKMSYGIMPQTGKNEIALSPSIASKFHKDIQSLIGKQLTFVYKEKSYPLTISGIFNASYDDFIISSDMEQKLYEGFSENAYSISYDVIDFKDIVTVNTNLKEQNIISQNASVEVANFLNTFQNINRLFRILSILIFVITFFLSAVLLVKQQNTRIKEIGLLSALGYPQKAIHGILINESIILSVTSTTCTFLLFMLLFFFSILLGLDTFITFQQLAISLSLTILSILGITSIANYRLIRIEPAQALK